tara:strand:+ start:403 stop:612 length:210 start_codon:yes stop_codon:yes gene_type:complete
MRTTERQLRGEDQPDLDTMRYDLAEQEAMNMNVSDIINMLVEGFEGLENMPDIDIKEEWNTIFGDSNND